MSVSEERAARLDNFMRGYYHGNVPPFVDGKINLANILCEHIDRQERAMENMAADMLELEQASLFVVIKHRLLQWWYERKQRSHERTVH